MINHGTHILIVVVRDLLVENFLSLQSVDRHGQRRQILYRRQLVSMKLHTAVGKC